MNLNRSKIMQTANRLVTISRELDCNPNKEKSGGILTLQLNDFSQKCLLDVGSYPLGKEGKYQRLSQEKAHRLYAHWLRQPQIAISSWQTRKPSDDRWGGAVLFTTPTEGINIVSFSGLAELTDEAVSLALGCELGFTADLQYAPKVIAISGNPVFEELYRKFRNNPQ